MCNLKVFAKKSNNGKDGLAKSPPYTPRVERVPAPPTPDSPSSGQSAQCFNFTGYLNGDYPSLLPFSPQASQQGLEAPYSPRGPFRGQSEVKFEDMMEVSPAPNPPNFDGVLGTAMAIEDARRLEFRTFWDRVLDARQTYYQNLVTLEVGHGLNNYPTGEWLRP